MGVATPSTDKGQATRARLLQAARQEALSTGGSVELARVADRAGVVPSLIYRYFGSKAGLVTALVDDFFDRLHAEVLDLDLAEHGDWAQRERLRLELGVRLHYAEPFAVILYAQLARDPQVARAQGERVAAVIAQAARYIGQAQRGGELPGDADPELAAAAMFGAMAQVLVAALGRSPHPAPEEVAETLWRQVAASVRIDPTTAGCA